MLPSNRWIALVAKLLRLTQERRIEWRPGRLPDDAQEPHRHSDVVFTTSYKDQPFRLYEYHYPEELTYGPDSYWVSKIALEFVDASGRTLYRVSEIPGLDDLLNAVKYQTSNIDAVLERILAD